MLQIDSSKLPILVVREPGVEVTDAELEETLKRLDELALYWAPHPLALILDVRLGRVPPMSQRHLLQRRLKRQTTQIVSCAVLMRSGVFQYLVSALLWKHQTPYPIYECTAERDAWAWSREQLRRVGHEPDDPAWKKRRDSIIPEF